MTTDAAQNPESSADSHSTDIWAWRHPRPIGAEGRCIGRTDLRLDPRKALRLARQVHKAAAFHHLPQVVYTSSLQRCANVGRVLRNWGWNHQVDDALLEFDFGLWDGKPWTEIRQSEIKDWTDSFGHYAPGGGETMSKILDRAASWPAQSTKHQSRVVIAHAGWVLARQWRRTNGDQLPNANQWPAAPAYGQLCQFTKTN